MPNQGKVPAYCHHRASGQAVVRIDGRDHYLGRYGSGDCHERYERLIATWRTSRQAASRERSQPRVASHGLASDPTVNEALLAYRQFAEHYYVKDGSPTKEFVEMGLALRPVRKLLGHQPLRTFGPAALKLVRQYMIDDQHLSRNVVNHRVNRIKRFIKWAVSEEIAPPHAYEALRTVSGLLYGRTSARETEPVKPVPWAWVEPVLAHASKQVAAMIQLQWFSPLEHKPCATRATAPTGSSYQT